MLTQDYTQKVFKEAIENGININELLEQIADLYFLNTGRAEVSSDKIVESDFVKKQGDKIIKNYA